MWGKKRSYNQTVLEGEKMKIQGLDRNDFEWIDKAFRHLMSAQAKQIKGAVECGSPEMARDNIASLEEVLETYEKIVKETRRYEKI